MDLSLLQWIAAVTAVLCIFTIGILRRADPSEQSLPLWALAVTLMGAGTLISALRDVIPQNAAIIVGNTVLAVGGVFMIQALRVLVGKTPGRQLQWYVGCSFVAIETIFTVVHPNQPIRTVFFSSFAAIVFYYCAGLLLRYREPGLDVVFRVAAFIYLISGITHTALALTYLSTSGPRTQSGTSSQLAVGMYAMAIVEWATVAVLLACVVFTRMQGRLSEAVASTDEANLRLLEMTWLDAATHVATRSRMAGLLDSAVQGSTLFGLPLTVVMVSFDGKDRMGLDPRTIDAAMSRNAEVLKGQLGIDGPAFETIGRWGDNSFLVILSGVALTDAHEITNRLACAYLAEDVRVGWDRFRIGATTVDRSDTTDDVLDRIEQAMSCPADSPVQFI